MINCSIHNYSEWIGAYLEDNLNKEDMLSAETFLQQHPQILDAYLEELEEFSLVPEEVKLYSKDQLNITIASTTHIHQNNFTEYFIGFYEGLLNITQKAELESFLSINPSLKNEFSVYGATKLLANNKLQYPHKKDLLKKTRPTVPLFWSISAAASVILLVGLWIFWPASGTNGLTLKKSEGIELIKNDYAHQQVIPQKNNTLIVKKQIHKKGSFYKNNIELSNSRQELVPVAIENNKPVQVPEFPHSMGQDQLALKTIPLIDITTTTINEELADNNPNLPADKGEKKGLVNKIFGGEQTYIEDYVNATFSVFKANKEDDDKWVLKVDRDEKGKSKKVKFTSPIFSVKSRN